MNLVMPTDKMVQEICEALGINYQNTGKLTITIEAGSVVTVETKSFANVSQSKSLWGIITKRYRLAAIAVDGN
jgi:hypothetical protein